MDAMRQQYTNDDLQKQDADLDDLSDDFEERKSVLIDTSIEDFNIKGNKVAFSYYNLFNLKFFVFYNKRSSFKST